MKTPLFLIPTTGKNAEQIIKETMEAYRRTEGTIIRDSHKDGVNGGKIIDIGQATIDALNHGNTRS